MSDTLLDLEAHSPPPVEDRGDLLLQAWNITLCITVSLGIQNCVGSTKKKKIAVEKGRKQSVCPASEVCIQEQRKFSTEKVVSPPCAVVEKTGFV